MGLLPSTIRLFLQMHKRFQFKGPVCSLGCQDIWATIDELKFYASQEGVDFAAPDQIRVHSSRTFATSEDLSRLSAKFLHPETMLKSLGIEGYYDIDKYNSDGACIIHDLNEPIPDTLVNKFGLVIDGGTVEHVFNIPQTLKSIVKMLRLGGCVVHINSFTINHGFYAFSPIVFFDYYSANGFDDLQCYVLEVDLADITRTYRRRHRVIKYSYGVDLRQVLDANKEILVVFVARKTAICDQPIVPTQGTYALRGDRDTGETKPQKSLFIKMIPQVLQPCLHPLRPILRASYRRYLRHRLRRELKVSYI